MIEEDDWEERARQLDRERLEEADLMEVALIVLLKSLVLQPDGSYVLPALYEVDLNEAKRLVGLV